MCVSKARAASLSGSADIAACAHGAKPMAADNVAGGNSLGPGSVSGPQSGLGLTGLGPLGVLPLGGSRCPSARLRVEKIEGGLLVAGVVVAANCQLALPAFGCLFLLAGCVLTAASYRGPGSDEGPENYAARIAFTGNSRVLGPACLSVGLLMLLAGGALCLLARRARRRETRLAFHCPLHGDFYPLSPVTAYGTARRTPGRRWFPCPWWGRSSKADLDAPTPKCPHSTVSSSRSSVSSAPPSPCPTPLPFLVTEGSVSGLVASAGALVSPDNTFGSIRSLSVSREVASFPLSRTPSPPSTIDRKSPPSGPGESPSPPSSSNTATWRAAERQTPAGRQRQVDELILATARRLELPPLVRQEVTIVSPPSGRSCATPSEAPSRTTAADGLGPSPWTLPSSLCSGSSSRPGCEAGSDPACQPPGLLLPSPGPQPPTSAPTSAPPGPPGPPSSAPGDRRRAASAPRKSVSILLPDKV